MQQARPKCITNPSRSATERKPIEQAVELIGDQPGEKARKSFSAGAGVSRSDRGNTDLCILSVCHVVERKDTGSSQIDRSQRHSVCMP